MDVARLVNTVDMGGKDVPTTRIKKPVKAHGLPKGRPVPIREPNLDQIKAALDDIIRNTRFQYVIKDEPNYFVVRIIDKDTDKVIREIPSRELQRLHESIQEALGLLFDREI